MLWSYSEVVAYIQEGEDNGGASRPGSQPSKEEVGSHYSPRVAFGGCHTCLNPKSDFILIAENSEIHGPNPLFTIPTVEYVDTDLNHLCTRILSADYQGLSNNKNIAGKNAQLLMPDITPEIHAAINHFILFDSEARGFVRPVCLAYITFDKNKLIHLAKPILEGLNKASMFIQHSNVRHCQEDFENLLKDLQSSKTVNSEAKSGAKSVELSQMKENAVTESALRDVNEILEVIKNFQLPDSIESQIVSFTRNISHCRMSEELISSSSSSSPDHTACSKTQSNVGKHLKHLLSASPGGMVIGLYHLYIMHKHFRRKYENIALSSNATLPVGDLYFGACIKSSEGDEYGSLVKCCVPEPPTASLSYLDCSEDVNVDPTFIDLLFRFSKSNEQSFLSDKLAAMQIKISNSLKGVPLGSHYQRNSSKMNMKTCRHTVNLNCIWDNLDAPEHDMKGAECSFLHVLQLFHQTESLLFAVLSGMPIIVLCCPEGFSLASTFLTALAIFVPTNPQAEVFVELDRKAPLNKESLLKIAAANICISDLHVIEDFLPPDLMQSVCILNLKNNSFTGPQYSGCLLSGIDERFQALPAEGPAFAVLVSVLLEVEQSVLLWRRIASSSLGDAQVTRHLLGRGFTACDIRIVQKLSMLSKS